MNSSWFNIAKSYIRQWFHGIEIDKVYPNLFQSSSIRWPCDKWRVKEHGITHVIDLQGTFDPCMDWLVAYTYWPIKDEPVLPDMSMLQEIVLYVVERINCGNKVLVHCTAGYNRSGLINALAIRRLANVTGKRAIEILRNARPGSLSNETFYNYVASLG